MHYLTFKALAEASVVKGLNFKSTIIVISLQQCEFAILSRQFGDQGSNELSFFLFLTDC